MNQNNKLIGVAPRAAFPTYAWVCVLSAVLSVVACSRSVKSDSDALPGLEMAVIPAGSFQMGLASDDKSSPVHAVTLKAFKLDKHEITVGQFRRFVAATNYKTIAEQGSGGNTYGCRVLNSGTGRPGTHAQSNWQDPAFPQTDAQPVVCVSHYDVQEFIKWLNKQSGRKFRLPSEAEWEYAAHGGTSSSYPWGEARGEVCRYENTSDTTPNPLANAGEVEAQRSDISPADVGVGGPALASRAAPSANSVNVSATKSNASANDESAKQPLDAAIPQSSNQATPQPMQRCSDGYFYTSPVGKFTANGFGLYDMLGNVRERVADCWHENYDGASQDGSVWSTGCSKSEYVARGGSWTFQVAPIASNRGNAEPAGSNDNLGFRLAEDI